LSCYKNDYGKNSRATGWEYNSKEGGFQVNTNYKEQETGPGLVFIEGGTFTMGRVQDDVMHDWNNTPTQQHVQSFYMDETEVTNIMYLEYLDWLKGVYPPTEPKYRNIYYGALPDTLVWRNRLGFNEMMTNNYLRHPAYANYPVVGVNWIQAVEFSKMLLLKMFLQKVLLIQKRILMLLLKPTEGTTKLQEAVNNLNNTKKETTLQVFTYNVKMDYFFQSIDYQQKQNGNMQHLVLLK